MNDTTPTRPWFLIMAFGLIVLLVGLFVAPERIWPAWLVAVVMLSGLALAGPVFVAIHRLCAARWADPLMRVPRAMASTLPVAVLAGLFVVFGASTLYEWTHAEFMEAHPIVEGKEAWLNLPAFLVRAAIVFVTWLAASWWMLHRGGRGAAGVYVILFAITLSVFSFDWVMSLEPEWFSTMFAVYNFSGLFLAGMAAIILLTLHGQRTGTVPEISPDRLHDLGKLLFALAFFWGYIWFCQFMLIWYTNIPEEAAWFASRHSGSWATLSLLNLAANFLVPFVVLLPAPAKRNVVVLTRVAVLVLFGRWLDLYIMVTPASSPEMPPLGVWEIGPPLAAIGAFFLLTQRGMSRPPAVP